VEVLADIFFRHFWREKKTSQRAEGGYHGGGVSQPQQPVAQRESLREVEVDPSLLYYATPESR